VTTDLAYTSSKAGWQRSRYPQVIGLHVSKASMAEITGVDRSFQGRLFTSPGAPPSSHCLGRVLTQPQRWLFYRWLPVPTLNPPAWREIAAEASFFSREAIASHGRIAAQSKANERSWFETFV
jgi:hypothetical protein